MKTRPPLLTCVAWFAAAHGQNLLPNPGFEAGTQEPEGWRSSGTGGAWPRRTPTSTNHAIEVRGSSGDDASDWRTEPLTLQPGGLYALRFRARRLPGADGGTAVAGTGRVNRDFRLDDAWRDYRFVFRQPDEAPSDFVRFGQWHVRGGVQFDDAELFTVLASHRRTTGPGIGEVRLGAGERVQDGTYTFRPDFGWEGTVAHRPLWRATAHFNSDRWVFASGSELIYRFEVGRRAQTEARIRAAVNHHVAGTLEVAARVDGSEWLVLGRLDGETRTGRWSLPPSLFPTADVLVRLRTAELETQLQVNHIEYEARFADAGDGREEGATDFMEVLQCDPEVQVQNFRLYTSRGQGLLQLYLAATLGLTGESELELERDLSGPTVRAQPGSRLKSRFRRDYAACPVVQADRPGDHELRFALRAGPNRALLETRTIAHLGHLYDPRAGYRLDGTNDLDLWWCESGWKVARTSQPPGTNVAVRPVTVAAARGEFEAAQVFLRPNSAQELIAVAASPLRGPGGAPGAISVEVNELAYVHVTRPTDESCRADWYPDPLPPLRLPCELPARQAYALWLTFHVAREAQPGDYVGEIALRLKRGDGETEIRLPLRVGVYDFALPLETHLRSALGLGSGLINRYHHLTNRADQIAVFEKYLENFAQHRISPYSFFDYAPIEVRFEGEGASKQARLDFTQFDAWAERWLDRKRADVAAGEPVSTAAGEVQRAGSGSPFNTFRLPLRGMGGGTFHSRHLGELEGFQEGTPEHERLFRDYLGQVERHLRSKGWLDQAFTYWFDEPDPKDYEFVVAGQRRIQAAAPGLERMLTEQPEPALLGNVDIWCALTPEWTREKVRARQEAGEEVWWYICTGPKAPYVTEFIDHPGTELRLWPWQSWQYGINGILIWATLWWHSPTAYPDQLQDPWEDPMSWMSGYGRPVGTRSPWGNGDGRFLYPPRRDPNAASEPCLDGPINSIRWENLRDGMEDYEYFWLLKREVERVGALKAEASERESDEGSRALLPEASRLLAVPETVSKDLTHFTTDPRPLLDHRDQVARMIERLQRLR